MNISTHFKWPINSVFTMVPGVLYGPKKMQEAERLKEEAVFIKREKSYNQSLKDWFWS